MAQIDPQALRLLLRYDPATGALYWRRRDVSMFKNGKYSAERAAAAWNSKLAGKRALTAVRKDGYQCGSVLGVNILAHRAIFAIVHGFYPPEIDHVQGVEAGNVIGNLREATSLTNSQNQKRRRDNTSGTTGVHFSRRGLGWLGDQALALPMGNRR